MGEKIREKAEGGKFFCRHKRSSRQNGDRQRPVEGKHDYSKIKVPTSNAKKIISNSRNGQKWRGSEKFKFGVNQLY